MAFTLPDLPYPKDALAPTLSAETFEYHHGKHHNKYVSTLNELIEGTDHETKSLEQIIGDAAGALFNNAAQTWNHTFYWESMKPGGGGKPDGQVLQALENAFGSYDAFKEEFTKAAVTQFGSGWAWLVLDGDRLAVTQTANADLPLRHGQTPLLTVDVWEHAYYIDYRNRRPDYVDAFLSDLVNWEAVAGRLAAAS